MKNDSQLIIHPSSLPSDIESFILHKYLMTNGRTLNGKNIVNNY